ncbi:MAG: serine/threonine-protein kinase [Planctomycetota bacterium]|nr:serine/threonine-protein kinase [Planctomycetota bacterium]
MRGFRYKYGDRPLDGYTIQRAAGRGGFGEVYYALSDSGREVALKMVSGYEQIELRGVGQCMNLKSPHLVTIFDVKHNDEGIPFVIMEFVSGPSLRQLLDESPSGLGTQKSAFFLREIGKGLAFLHECGIVHRDLKPGNIFYENGYTKIGDYGLSKAMASSQHSGQTITVGTVHYMAPEISMGKYDRSIDIYAMGAMLYEMLTGQTPYLGSSPGEILMKHMTAEPDVSNIEEPFATVIKKAMHRDPNQRYANVQEMVEAVFGSEHVQQSVSCFSPDSLSMVAQRVAERVAVGGGSATPPPLPRKRGGPEPLGDRMGEIGDRLGQRMSRLGDRMGQIGERIGQRMSRLGDRLAGAEPAPAGAAPKFADADPICDPLNQKQRTLLGLCVMGIIAAVVGFISPRYVGNDPVANALGAFLAILGATAGLRLAHRKLMPQLAAEGSGLQRVVFPGFAILLLMAFSFPIMLSHGNFHQFIGGTIAAMVAPLLLVDWMSAIKPARRERVSFRHAVGVGLIAFLIALIFHGFAEWVAAVLAGTSLAVQVLSPWDPTAAQRRLQHGNLRNTSLAPGAAASHGLADPAAQTPVPQAHLAPLSPSGLPPLPNIFRPARPVATFVRYLWLGGIPLLFSSGIMLLVWAGTERMSGDEFSLAVGFGIGLILLAVLSIIRSAQSTFTDRWSYLIKPLFLYACLQTILISALMLGNARLSGDETMIAVFFIIFPIAVMPIVLFVRFGRPSTPSYYFPAPAAPAPQSPAMPSDPSASPAPTPYPASASTIIPQPPLDPRPMPIRAATGLLGLAGGFLLLVSMILGLAVAVDIPGMLAAGLPDPSISRNFARDAQQAGIEDWPQLMQNVLVILTGIGMVIASVLLMLARRWAGPLHMFRALIGIAGCGIALITLYHGIANHWNPAPGRPMPAVVVDVIKQAQGPIVISAAVFFLVSIIFLFWPPRRQNLPQFPYRGA